MSLPESIATERLTLRPPRAADAGPMALYAGDRRVAEMLEHVPHPYPPGAAEAFIERILANRFAGRLWVMDASGIDGPEFIGVISLRPAETAGVFQLGYWVGPPFWSTGYASEAAGAVVAAARAAGVRRLEARVVEENEASARVLRNAGFEETGAAPFFSVARGGMARHRLFAMEFGPEATT
ncbi:GNAT family N-acetyltransferase [Pikeienuella sp. HZG-20]|uniref:GNAT family N-acetyltransferase n=1 Tax=Paludibacillus litoralis TaxID=3133267 RepID=UPI0030EBC15F